MSENFSTTSTVIMNCVACLTCIFAILAIAVSSTSIACFDHDPTYKAANVTSYNYNTIMIVVFVFQIIGASCLCAVANKYIGN